jgi:hypothetical protein
VHAVRAGARLEALPASNEATAAQERSPAAHTARSRRVHGSCAEKIKARHGGKFVCPLCREEGPAAMASELRWQDGSSAGTAVKGSWGTKVTSIVEQVVALPAGDKCLIFSMWDDMLTLIGRALGENEVPFSRLQGVGTLDAALHRFRTATVRLHRASRRARPWCLRVLGGACACARRRLCAPRSARIAHRAALRSLRRPPHMRSQEVRALLLPLKSGANGISLVEAQHVFLAEPLLEREVEAQAVGRVHRGPRPPRGARTRDDEPRAARAALRLDQR